MSHPKISDLLEFCKNLLPAEQKGTIQEHIEACDSCRQEIADIDALIGKLESWSDTELSETYIDNQLKLLDAESIGEGRKSRLLRFPLLSRSFVHGSIVAATAIISTIAVQSLILNPLNIQKQLRTVFEIAPLPLAYPIEGAIPDTMIVLNVHEDGSYSTSVFEGFYSLEALKSQLAREVNKGEYWTLVVNATKLRSPIRLRYKDLAFFKQKLGINEFRFWTEDVLSSMTSKNLTLEELEEVVSAGQPQIEVTLQGIDIKALHQMSITVGIEGNITIYDNPIDMADTHYLLQKYYNMNPEGKLQIRYKEGSVADSVKTAIKGLADSIGITEITSALIPGS